jgi:hypothetical protein
MPPKSKLVSGALLCMLWMLSTRSFASVDAALFANYSESRGELEAAMRCVGAHDARMHIWLPKIMCPNLASSGFHLPPLQGALARHTFRKGGHAQHMFFAIVFLWRVWFMALCIAVGLTSVHLDVLIHAVAKLYQFMLI